jgi:hypothetical protein
MPALLTLMTVRDGRPPRLDATPPFLSGGMWVLYRLFKLTASF